MRFRPCIDIHNGKVKQIVGGSLRDEGDRAEENFVAGQDAAFYAAMYRRDGLKGGHVILLNPFSSPNYAATRKQALLALAAYPGGLQVGGGVTDQNAEAFLKAGASKVIVTSYVFQGGQIHIERLERLTRAVGRGQLVLDLSCRRRDGDFYIVTDRWQKFTDVKLSAETLDELSGYCSEFLVHAADAEGKAAGVEDDVVRLLGGWGKIPVTYAGGIAGRGDLLKLRTLGQNRLDFTVGSALDLFGGSLPYSEMVKIR